MSEDDKVKKQIENKYFKKIEENKKKRYYSFCLKCYYENVKTLTKDEKTKRKSMQSIIGHHLREINKKNKKKYMVIDYSKNRMVKSLTKDPEGTILSFPDVQKKLTEKEW